jgi:hypothetical protein
VLQIRTLSAVKETIVTKKRDKRNTDTMTDTIPVDATVKCAEFNHTNWRENENVTEPRFSCSRNEFLKRLETHTRKAN